MGLLHPIITRPANHLLFVRYRKEAAWVEAAGYAWLLLSWYFPLFLYSKAQAWFWWLWAAAPVVVIAFFYRRAIDLFRRCGKGDEFIFDSAAGTLSHNGRIVRIRNIRKVVFQTFLRSTSGRDQGIYTLRLLLDEGSKIDLAVLREEKPVAELADQVAAFLGMRMEKEYTTAGDRDGIKSLDLTQRQLEVDENSPQNSATFRDPPAGR